jgi:hypothetical protein
VVGARFFEQRGSAAACLIVALALVTLAPVSADAVSTSWDPRVAQIARDVETLRGLKFERPVPVDFLSEAAFKNRVTVDRSKLSPEDEEEVRRSQEQLRAVGLLPGDVDLLSAQSSLRRSGALAFYDPDTKRATARGKKLTPAVKVTLAHELTHALQDQHFDLNRLQRAAARNNASAAFTALVEGDAVRVQQLYVDKLSDDERAAYERSRSTGARSALGDVHAAGVPDSLLVFFETPYVLGPLMLQVVAAAEGQRAIDALFREPPTADAAFLTPTTLVDGSTVTNVEPPALQSGEVGEGKPEVFGAFVLYLILATRSDPVDALRVADGWAGDAMVTFKRGDTTCVRASFAGRSSRATTDIERALEAWAAKAPARSAGAQRTGSLATLTACDPGTAARTKQGRPVAALTVAVVRNTLLANLTRQGLGTGVAGCVANGVVGDPTLRPVLEATVDDPTATPGADVLRPLQQKARSITARCELER